MALVAQLEGSFGAGGFDLSVSVTGMGAACDGATPPTLALDTDDLTSIVDALRDPDLSALEGAVAAILPRIGELVSLVPGLDALVAPLTAVIDLARAATSTRDLGVLLAGVDASRDGATGAAALLDSIGSGLDLVAAPGIAPIADLLAQAVPGFDVQELTASIRTALDGIRSVVGAVGSLMAIEGVTRELVAGLDLTASFLQPSRIDADRARLAGWAASDALVGLMIGIDPDDPALVDLVAGPLLDYAVTLRRFTGTVTTGMAWADATLAGLDLDATLTRVADATAGAMGVVGAPIAALAADIRQRLERLLTVELPPAATLDEFVAGLGGLAGRLAGAIDGIDPAALTRPIGDGLSTVLEPLDAIEGAANEVVGAVHAAFDAVTDAISVIDLRAVTDAIATVLAPFAVALDALDDLVGAVQGALADAATAIDGIVAPVQTVLSDTASTIHAAFAAIDGVITELHLDELGPALRAGATEVAAAIAAAQLEPVFSAIVTALDAIATALSLTPRDLLPDDARQALEDGCAQLQAVDLGTAKVDLLAELDAMRAEVEQGVLDGAVQARDAVVDFLDSIDPRPLVVEFEQGAYADLVARLREVDLLGLLAPVLDAVDAATAAIGALDLDRLTAPIDDVVDEVATAVRALDVDGLLGPIDDQVAELRTSLTDTLGLDGWADRIDAAEAATAGFLQRFDLRSVAAALDGAHAALVAEARRPSAGGGPLATVVTALAEGLGLAVRPDSFERIRGWLAGAELPSEQIGGRLTAGADAIEALADSIAGIDLAAVTGQLDAHHGRLSLALATHPAESLLRLRLDAEILVASPADLLGTALANRDRLLGVLRAATASVRVVAAASRSELDAVVVALRGAVTPLLDVPTRLRALLGVLTGVPTEGRAMRMILADVLGAVRPSIVLDPILGSIGSLGDRVAAAIGDAVFGPARDAIDSIVAVIDVLDLSFVTDGITAARDAVADQVESLRPASLLGPAAAELTALQQRLIGTDPVGPVRATAELVATTITTFETEFRPTVLVGPALDSYDRVVGIIDSIDIADVFAPVRTALDGIEGQLARGMDELANSLEDVKVACASGGPSLGAALGAATELVGAVGSVSVGGSFGL